MEGPVRRMLAELAVELAYMALVGTAVVPPRSLLRRKVADVVKPEYVSFLAHRIAEEVDVSLNASLGMRLGGVPRCELLEGTLHELYLLCISLRTAGDRPLYSALSGLVAPLAISALAAGLHEGSLLLSAYRAYRGSESDVARVVAAFGRRLGAIAL